ncbi:MAG: response regulator [Chloroflexota bacterium]
MTNTILVIEDDPTSSRLTGYALEQAGYHVLMSSNGLEGIRKAREESPALVILDVMLPGLDGFEVCHRLRSDPQTVWLPIIMLSAKAREVDKETGFKVGASDYLTKPVDPSTVVSKVQALLAQRSASESRAIAFLGSKGGLGTTTVAVNTAIALSQDGKRVILLDLSPCSGAVATHLGVNPGRSVVELLTMCDRGGDSADSTGSAAPVDRQDLEEAMASHYTGLRVLSSAQEPADWENIPSHGVGPLLDELRQMADYVLLDLSADPSSAGKEAIRNCDLNVIVIGTDSDALASIRPSAALLGRLGVSQDRMATVVIDHDGLLPKIEVPRIKSVVESSAGVSLLGLIPHCDEGPGGMGIEGVPVTLADSANPVAMAFRQMAQGLSVREISILDTGKGRG